jgi:ligand-binding sensor domain-containing protein
MRVGQNWQAITTQDGLANNSIRHILVAADDTVWLVTDGGVSHYRP